MIDTPWKTTWTMEHRPWKTIFLYKGGPVRVINDPNRVVFVSLLALLFLEHQRTCHRHRQGGKLEMCPTSAGLDSRVRA